MDEKDKQAIDMIDEQREQVGQPTSDIGKFGSAEELLAAYNALEKEFTKRCQLIKQLQAAAAHSDAQDRPDTPPEPAPEPQQSEGDGSEGDGGIPNEVLDGAIAYAEAIAGIPEVMNACIARYKQSLMGRVGVHTPPSGSAVIVPAKRPTSLKEAKALADSILS